MAMIALKVPVNIQDALKALEVPGEKVDSAHYHVTLFVLGDDVPITQISATLEAIYRVVETTQPFSVRIDQLTSFPKGTSGTPMICPVREPALNAFREKLRRALDQAEIPYDKKFPDFKGHVTLAYYDGEAPPDKSFAPLIWTATEVILYGGDEGDERLTIRFPFTLEGARQAYFRGLVRLARA
jgi:2'-5' RNA ligase